MKIMRNLTLAMLLLVSSFNFGENIVKVVCVGDSITFGSGIPERTKLSYPAQLQNILGDNYQVHNFGVSGSTMLKKGNYPYWNYPQLKNALDLKPDVVFIKLGTNDSKKVCWQHKSEFAANYKEMINLFKNCGSNPRIVALLPVPSFIDGDTISSSRINKEIIPIIRKVALDEKIEVLDLHSPLADKKQWFPDGVHPNPFGAQFIAWRIYELLKTKVYSKNSSAAILSQLGIEFETTYFHGYPCYVFTYNGRSCRIAAPLKPAKDLPWIWRARFWGHEPQFDISMLERGFHIVYCDVAGYFGNFEAVAMWNKFYDLTRKLKFEKKAILEGMSRGGLIIYNWATLNPDKVAAIYADAPVCDFRSWPGGKGKGIGAPTQYRACLNRYRIDDLKAESYKKMPIDLLKPLADANIPLMHVCGLSDKVVPYEENTAILAERYKEMGGKIEEIRKPGVGHHPHSLRNPYPITRFALRASGRWISDAVVPAPAAEFRGGAAGWGGGTWWNQFENINKLVQKNADKIDVVFFGDSITQNWTGSQQRMAEKDGKRAIDNYFGMYNTIGMGISGDRTEHLLYRLENGNFDGISPKVVVLMIGVNNLLSGDDSPEEIAGGITQVVKALLKKLPKTHIILHGTFPTGAHPFDPNRLAVNRIHELIVPLSRDKRVHYIDLRKKFLNKNRTLNYDYFSKDNIHLHGKAYDVWAEAIKPLIDDMMSL